MQGNAEWKSKAGDYLHPTGCSTSKSSPQVAFDERCHTLPRNSMECEIYSWFTEGLATKDVQEAQALLEALA